ncbi:MAG: alpha/beta fold hydrolase [Ilumatobacter sp.]|nr:alpha/beta fold hydrolase [Ilumatobacter sp.]
MADKNDDRPIELPWLPPAHIVPVAGRGEFFVRHHRHPDPTRPTLLLLHGWTASADLQFFTAYEDLAARYSFVAVDHRGHGRGPRPAADFMLEDAADDAAAVARELSIDRVIAIGYSMGGPISLLLAQRHPALVQAVLPQATALEWSASLRERLMWRLVLPVMGSALRSWTNARLTKRFVERALHDEHELAAYVPWMLGEMRRADASAIVQAGKALSKFDARPWASTLDVPAGLLLTTKDRLVKPRKQRALASALRANVREISADHFAPVETPDDFVAATVALVDALAEALAPEPVATS